MLDNVWTALEPVILEACAASLTIAIAWVSLTLKRRLGLDIEARHREALHSAMMSGARAALEGDMTTAEMRDAAVAYAKRSVPDAIRALAAPDNVLHELAASKVTEALTRWMPGELLTVEEPLP